MKIRDFLNFEKILNENGISQNLNQQLVLFQNIFGN